MELTFFADLGGTFIMGIHPNTELENVTAPPRDRGTLVNAPLRLPAAPAGECIVHLLPSSFISPLFTFLPNTCAWNVLTAPEIFDEAQHKPSPFAEPVWQTS